MDLVLDDTHYLAHVLYMGHRHLHMVMSAACSMLLLLCSIWCYPPVEEPIASRTPWEGGAERRRASSRQMMPPGCRRQNSDWTQWPLSSTSQAANALCFIDGLACLATDRMQNRVCHRNRSFDSCLSLLAPCVRFHLSHAGFFGKVPRLTAPLCQIIFVRN